MKQLILRAYADKFFRQSLIVVILSQFGSLFHFLYQYVMAHELSKQEFGLLNALLAFAMILLVPMATLQMVVSRYISEYKANNDFEKLKTFFSLTARNLAFLSMVLIVAFFLFRNILADFFHVSDPSIFFLLGLFIISGAFSAFGLGVLQGLQKFFALGGCLFLAGLLKWGGAFILRFFNYDLMSVLIALTMASFCVLVPIVFVTKNLWVWPISKKVNFKETFSYALPSFVSYGLLSVILSMDLVLIQHFLGKESSQAGLYATAAVLGKTILYVSLSIVMVMFPKVTESHLKLQDSFSHLKKALCFAVLISGGALSIFILFPQTVLVFFGKEEALAAVQYLRLYSVAMFFMVLLHICVNYCVAIGQFRFIKFLIFIFISEYVAIYILQASLIHVLWCMILFLSVGLAGILTEEFNQKKGAKRIFYEMYSL